jgi:preprotein translocase subunit YajC
MGDPSGFSFVISMLLVFAVMWLLILRPQSKRQKERERMLKKVGKGDRIVTTGGFYGSIVGLKGDDVLLVKLGDNRPVEMLRHGVASVLPPEAAPAATPPPGE